MRYAESTEMAELAVRASFPIPEEPSDDAPAAGSTAAAAGRFDLTYEVTDLTGDRRRRAFPTTRR